MQPLEGNEITPEEAVKTMEELLKEEKHAQVEHIFTYHRPQGNQQAMYQEIRVCASVLAHTIVELTPTSREQSLAITNLQQAVMFANAAIAIHGAGQEDNKNAHRPN